MKVVLLRCPWITILQPPDIGVAYLIASLKSDGHEVRFFDLNMEFYRKIDEADKERLIYSSAAVLIKEGDKIFTKYTGLAEEAVGRILELKPDVVGFNVWQMNGRVSREFARKIKKADSSIVTVFGGPDAYPLWSGMDYINEPAVDLVVYGEAEITFKRILDDLGRNGRVRAAPGTLFRDNGAVIDSGFGSVVEDLDKLPMPALEDFPLGLYVHNALPISFTRGCVHKCEYCPREMYPHFRSRSASGIVKEIELRAGMFPDKNKYFVCDAALNANIVQIRELCGLIIEKGIKATFGGFAYTHPGADRDFLKLMRKAGFNELVYGVESGSERMLESLGKKIEIKTIERILKDTYEAGIEVSIDILVGLPGESEDDFRKTLEFLSRNGKYIKKVGVNHFGVLPYSKIYGRKEEYKLVPEDVIMGRIGELMGRIQSLALPETVKAGFDVEREGDAGR